MKKFLTYSEEGTPKSDILEILISNSAIRALIRENNIHQMNNYIKSGRDEGMRLMDDSLLNLVKKGEISSDDALRYSIAQKAIKSQLEIISRQANL